MAGLPWLEEAHRFIGLSEIPGSEHNAEILQMWKDIKLGGIKDDEVPWCAAFVGAMLVRAGLPSTRSGAARSYLNWGIELKQPIHGCVAVFTRTGGGHVGFVVGKAPDGNLLVLGGNQNDVVNIRAFDLGRVLGYRWPADVPWADEPLAVATMDSPLSTSEA